MLPAGTVGKNQPRAGPFRAASLGSIGKAKRSAQSANPGLYRTLAISPDGRRVAVERTDPQTQNRDIWLLDAASGDDNSIHFRSRLGTRSPRGLPTEATSSSRPIEAAYMTCIRKLQAARATRSYFTNRPKEKAPTVGRPNGKFLIYYSLGQPTHLRLLAVDGPADRKPVPLVDPQFSSMTGRFSPDGHWIAYSSNESGKNEISVRPFDAATGSAGAQ